MPDDRNDPLADLFTMFAMPISGTLRSVEQFRKGVDEFLVGVENFNRTMANLNETSERINSLLADVEEPIRAAVPQVTRTVKTADEMMRVVSGPAMAVAPGLSKLAETLNTPAFAQLPSQIGQFSEVLGELSRRLGPLSQMAGTAGGLFGGLRVPGMRPQPAGDVPATAVRPDQEAGVRTAPAAPAAEQQSTNKTAAKRPSTKKTAAKKTTAKTTTAKTTGAKRAPAKKTAAKKSA